MRGFFRMDYPREGGAGGTAVFTGGSVAGWDTGGCFFRGDYVDKGLGVKGALSLDFPNGGTSVTGGKVAKGAPPVRIVFKIASAARPDEMVLRTPDGDVKIKLTRVSSL